MNSTDWQEIYRQLTSQRGGVVLDDWSQVQLTGNDRVKFLHNMCTNDIRRLESGQACEAFCTDVKGKILAHVLVIAESDRLVLLTVPGQAEKLITHLDRYIIREDVQLTDITTVAQWVYWLGPQAIEAAANHKNECVPTDIVWPGGFLSRTALDLGPNVAWTSPAFTALRVESCFPLFGIDFDDLNLPQEIDRDQRAISFTKGCYLGQETVARIDALGHVNRKLVLLKFAAEALPTSGTILKGAEQEVGKISTASWSPATNAPLAIAFVKRGFNNLGTRLQSEFGEAEIIPPLKR